MKNKKEKGDFHAGILIDLLKNNPNKAIAEVGVFAGKTTSRILNGVPEIEVYYAVDRWECYPDYKKIINPKRFLKNPTGHNFVRAKKLFKDRTKKWRNKVKIIEQNSYDAAKEIEDESLDLVFIDANHSYEYVKKDILAWLPKVKKGGILAGHDYEEEIQKDEWGVKEAVEELIPEYEVKDTTWIMIKQ